MSNTAPKRNELAVDASDLEPAMEAAPDDVEIDEGYVDAFDDVDLYWREWSAPDAEPRAVVALMHGFAEHVNRYHHVGSWLVRAGYTVIGLDIRGHGRSTGARGYVSSFEEYPRDYHRLVDLCEERADGKPIVSLSHSHGGLVALHHALRKSRRVSAYVVTSPFCAFALEVPKIKAVAGDLMSRVWGGFSLPTDLEPSVVSHIDRVVEAYRDDPLVFDTATARWFTETKRAHGELRERAPDIDAPFLFLVSGKDELADPHAAEEIYHRLGSSDRELEIFPELKHEILNEAPWADLMIQIDDWFSRHI